MRPGVTPVPISNTMVKTRAAENTRLETVCKDRWMPAPEKIISETKPVLLRIGKETTHSGVRILLAGFEQRGVLVDAGV